MLDLLTVASMEDVLSKHKEEVRRALEDLFPDPGESLSIEAIATGLTGRETVADLLLATLNKLKRVPAFISYLRARGIEPLPIPRDSIFTARVARFAGITIGEPEEGDFAGDGLVDFWAQARAFRCRIMGDAKTVGSGAFVSRNLVLTAMHVVEEAESVGVPGGAGLRVRASDGKIYPARRIWHLCYHEDEKAGKLPPSGTEAQHQDVALLIVHLPLGHLYGHVRLPAGPPTWDGARRFVLIHYPNGRETGFTPGAVRRDQDYTIRFPHDINTRGGSSGAVAFDREYQFIGIHQGRWKNVRRLVPFEQFHRNNDFLQRIAENVRMRYLWSLDGNLDGPIVIGRQQFLRGLAAMVQNPASLLRGIWIRRVDTSRVDGLGFGFDMLRAYLRNQDEPDAAPPRHSCIRIAPTLDTRDLLAEVAAAAGVAAPTEGTDEGARALELIGALQAAAAGAGLTRWFFFDNPPNGLAELAMLQFEHLTARLPAEDNLRIVLAGYETYRLALLRFASPEEAETARQIGLLAEELGPLTRGDVEVTLREILASLDPDKVPAPGALETLLKVAIDGIAPGPAGPFAPADLGKLARGVRKAVKTHLEIER